MALSKPLAIDLFAGLGGWAEGLLAEGWDVVGFDIERHRYPARSFPEGGARKVAADGVDFNNPAVGSSRNRSFNYANECAMREAPLTGGWMEYPAQLVLQDVLTLDGAQFRDAALIVASPPCQEYSYMAMPWTRAKAKAAAIRADATGQMLADLNRLFDACFRIQAEASSAASRHIPMVVENVKGAQPWVGQAAANYGSFYLWGDMPVLQPGLPGIGARRESMARGINVPGFRFAGRKNAGGSWYRVSHNNVPHSRGDAVTHTPHMTNPAEHEGIKQRGSGAAWWRKALDERRKAAPSVKVPGGGAEGWFGKNASPMRQHHSGSTKRKAASALIAKIPLPLARYIAAIYLPK